jgi:toxin ParE1/3/4
VAKKATGKRTVHLTDRALRDLVDIESHSSERFGKRVAAKYIGKLEAGIGRVADNPALLREETPFHPSLKFYRVEQDLLVCETGIEGKIMILTLLHASMDIPSRLAELEPNLCIETDMLLTQLSRSSQP